MAPVTHIRTHITSHFEIVTATNNLNSKKNNNKNFKVNRHKTALKSKALWFILQMERCKDS